MEVDFTVEEPLNREPPVGELIQSFITDRNGYDRNHGPIPHIVAEEHIVHVDGEVSEPLALTIDQLQGEYRQYEIVSALQCAGNRRHTMRTLLKEVNGIDWGDSAVMNCAWKGPRLKDILAQAGLPEESDDKHVAFTCIQTKVQGADWYGGSIELWRAMKAEADIILALEMNGSPLPIKHGFPVRMIVPGVSGCRSVKWLDRITVQSEESQNLYQRYDYKRLPPEAVDADAAKRYWDITPALQDMPINSVIAVPATGDTVFLSTSGLARVCGYALPQADQGPVIKVEVSGDDGSNWVEARIIRGGEQESKWAWSLWEVNLPLTGGENRRVLSRATDKGGNKQNANPVWNLRGVGYDGYGEARGLDVRRKDSGAEG